MSMTGVEFYWISHGINVQLNVIPPPDPKKDGKMIISLWSDISCFTLRRRNSQEISRVPATVGSCNVSQFQWVRYISHLKINMWRPNIKCTRNLVFKRKYWSVTGHTISIVCILFPYHNRYMFWSKLLAFFSAKMFNILYPVPRHNIFQPGWCCPQVQASFHLSLKRLDIQTTNQHRNHLTYIILESLVAAWQASSFIALDYHWPLDVSQLLISFDNLLQFIPKMNRTETYRSQDALKYLGASETNFDDLSISLAPLRDFIFGVFTN